MQLNDGFSIIVYLRSKVISGAEMEATTVPMTSSSLLPGATFGLHHKPQQFDVAKESTITETSPTATTRLPPASDGTSVTGLWAVDQHPTATARLSGEMQMTELKTELYKVCPSFK